MYNRWYDKYPELKSLLILLETVDKQYLEIIAHDFLQIILEKYSEKFDEVLQQMSDNPPPRYNRWYDENEATGKTLAILQNLDPQSRKILSREIISVVKQIRELHAEEEEPNLSLGLGRVLGLYQSENGRRWYDKNKDLSFAMKIISTLPEEDFYNIMEGLSVSISS